MRNNLLKKGLVCIVIVLFIGLSVITDICKSVKTINKVVYEDVINDRIEDINGLKYDDRGYIIDNHLFREDANLVNTSNNGPGEINPIWITIKDLGLGSLSYMKAYKDYIYGVGSKYYTQYQNLSALLAKFNITNGEFLWMKTWEGFHPSTGAYNLDIYNDSIYIVGFTGPPGGILFWRDAFLCKYDLDGNLLWSKLINETTFDYITDVEVYDNYLYLCGGKTGDSWILKYDFNGNKIWGKTHIIPGTDLSQFYDLEIYNGCIYAEGQTDNFSDENAQDVYVAKISLNGELIWYREWGGKGNQLGTGIDMEDGYIYICSYGYLLKYDTEGNLQWVAGSGTQSNLVDIKLFNGSIYTTGQIWVPYPYQRLWDVVLQKYDTSGNLIWYLTYGDEYTNDGGRCIDIYNNSFYLCGYIDVVFILNYDVDLFSYNTKPDTPSKPFGRTNGVLGVEYNYNTSTTDPEGNLLSYCFSWEDENVTLTEWMNSGDTVSASYSWSERGKYNVRVRARDECGFVSDWSDPLTVIIPRNKIVHNSVWLLERFPLLERLFFFIK